jgi:hypothetical protein
MSINNVHLKELSVSRSVEVNHIFIALGVHLQEITLVAVLIVWNDWCASLSFSWSIAVNFVVHFLELCCSCFTLCVKFFKHVSITSHGWSGFLWRTGCLLSSCGTIFVVHLKKRKTSWCGDGSSCRSIGSTFLVHGHEVSFMAYMMVWDNW